MKSSEIRESFLKFFEGKAHRRIKSASLIPDRDPTLFFTNAGMVPFKNVFLGQEDIGTKRATTSQKCMRVSGKHNDLENVGRTHRHHTFFEMLGNFSFGDYFKRDAIAFAWEYLTEVLKLDKTRLWVTVFREDDEAEALWKELSEVPAHRILRLDEADNFWSMGETGPCGPCTEIHYDFDGAEGKTRDDFLKGSESGRIMEIWNLVFMQFDRSADGTMKPLPKPSVDTGMGLERLACVVQGVYSNYDSDLFTPLLAKISELSGQKYRENEASDVSMRVVADHIRAACFLIGDGVLPSNEGRGYVLRRIMRRAIRHGRMLGMHEAFFYKILPVLTGEMGDVYPELVSNQKFIEEVIRAEEQRFLETLEKGMEIIEGEIKTAKKAGNKILSGAVAFKLYDTFGFPLDLTETIATEAGLTVDGADFEQCMTGQRAKARAAWRGSGDSKVGEVHQLMAAEGFKTQFLGYQSLECISKITAIVKDGKRVDEIKQGDEAEVYTEYSPFYAESGGQVGDQGIIIAPQALAEVKDTQRPAGEMIAHLVRVREGVFKVEDEVHLKVSPLTRGPTRLNHTATHLLHAALRQVLGEHVKQAGSLVTAERLRFDFSHFQPMTREEILKVEDMVNDKIREDIEVNKREMSYDEAIGEGAMALFGEKYGDKVRVLKVEGFSTELCGGTHVDRTGEIGIFKIIRESSVAAGVRRIEGITGAAVIENFREMENALLQLSKLAKTDRYQDTVEKWTQQNEQLKKLEKEVSQLKAKVATGGGGGGSGDILSQAKDIGGVKVLALRRDIDDLKSLRDFSDQVKDKLGSGVSVIGSATEGKVTLIVRVSKDLTPRFDAGKLAKELAAMVGGSGGGKAEMAQAGGSNIEGLDGALQKVYELVG